MGKKLIILFLYHLWQAMGKDQFNIFLSQLFQCDRLNYETFESLVLAYLPDYKDNLHLWLKTTEYPEELRGQ